MSLLIKQKQAELETLRMQLKTDWDQFETQAVGDGQQAPVMSAEDVNRLNDRATEINLLAADIEKLQAAAKAAEPVGRQEIGGPAGSKDAPRNPEMKGIALLAKQISDGPPTHGQKYKFSTTDALRKATVTTSSGYAPESVRTGEVVDSVYQRPAIIDVINMIPWDQAAYVWMAETTRTNAAAPKAETAAGDESTLVWTEQSVNLETIKGFIPVSEKSMRYSAELRRLVEISLPNQVRQVLGSQVLTGDGSTPNLRGFNNLTGIQSQAKDSDPTLTAILRAMVAVMSDAAGTNGGADPNLIVLNPADWAQVMDTRTADGIYIIGDPANRNPFGQPLWGLRVLVTSQQTQNTGLVLDTNYFDIAYNDVASLEFTNSHGTNFQNNVMVFRSTFDAALVSRRDAAACKVTGI